MVKRPLSGAIKISSPDSLTIMWSFLTEVSYLYSIHQIHSFITSAPNPACLPVNLALHPTCNKPHYNGKTNTTATTWKKVENTTIKTILLAPHKNISKISNCSASINQFRFTCRFLRKIFNSLICLTIIFLCLNIISLSNYSLWS